MQSRNVGRLAAWSILLASCWGVAPLTASAHETGERHVHFQKPEISPAANNGLQFRKSRSERSSAATGRQITDRSTAQRASSPSAPSQSAGSQTSDVQLAVVSDRPERLANRPTSTARSQTSARRAQPSFASPGDVPTQAGAPARSPARQRYGRVVQAGYEPALMDPQYSYEPATVGYCDHCPGGCDASCGCPEPSCGIYEPGCGIIEPGCGLVEAGCGIVEASCGCNEPACGICEPGCAMMEPGCAILDPHTDCGDPTCGVPGCGSCVARPGPDYWCFPVCLPRLKDVRFWAGVHGFKGPRDILDDGPGDGNFGFQEGLSIGGRMPLLGMAFPQLSYQLGYQAVQSRLSGTSDGSPSDRPQQFVTAGVFRRVSTGLQFGAVWDSLRDDLGTTRTFNQVRYQVSLASPEGREFGFRGSSGTNNEVISGRTFQAVDQYTLFYGWQFRRGGHGRFWGGASNDNEGIFGAEFDMPLNDRWSVFSTFNYLIPEEEPGLAAATEESWNIGINLVWHLGRMARKGRYNPHRAMFETADNGSMFIDVAP